MQEVVAIGLCEQQQVVHEPCQPCDLGLHQPLDALDLGAVERAVGLALDADEQVQLPAQDGQGRAQLVRGVGDEFALRGERRLEPVEHVVQRFRQGVELSAGPGRQEDPRREVAAVDSRGDRRGSADRSGDPRPHRISREHRQHQRQRPGQLK